MHRVLPVMRAALLFTLAVGVAKGAASTGAPRASVITRVHVGLGAGVPAVDRATVWVPNTLVGTVSRVDVAHHRVAATVKLGRPAVGGGYLDSATIANGSVWVARDAAGEIDRVDAATNRIKERIKVAPRPGGLTSGGGFIWAFHFRIPSVTRIDATTGAKLVFSVPDGMGTGTGIAYTGDAVWLLTEAPAALIKLDPNSGAVLAHVLITPPGAPKHGVIDTWWVVAGGGSLWLANPNYNRVTRVDVATATVVASIPVPVSTPFGVAFYRGAAWVSGLGKVSRIDPATNRPGLAVGLAKGSTALFTNLASGPSTLWATDYDHGVLYRLGGS